MKLSILVKFHEMFKKCVDRNNVEILSSKRFARQKVQFIETIKIKHLMAAIQQRLFVISAGLYGSSTAAMY